MRSQKRCPSIFFLFALCSFAVLFSGCSQETIAKSPLLLHGEIKEYYPIGQTQRVKYSYPTRPFDTDVTIEGIGWQNGKFFALLSAKVNTQEGAYSYASMRLTPKISYQNRTMNLTEVLWEEGSNQVYKDNVYRYAVTSPDANLIPPGTLPDEISVSHATYPLPPKLPTAQTLPPKSLLQAEVGKIDKLIASEELTYQVTGLIINGDKRKMSLHVSSETGDDETSKFLLLDDKGRIYHFANESIPQHYEPGESKVELDIVQTLPEDAAHLRLIIFEAEYQQPSLFWVKEEASIEFY